MVSDPQRRKQTQKHFEIAKYLDLSEINDVFINKVHVDQKSKLGQLYIISESSILKNICDKL